MSSSDSKLPLRDIPGDYGLPFFGAIKDRFDFHYNQGTDGFFRSRMQSYQSTVYRANVPPGPFNAPKSKAIVLVDAVSFPILFDNSKVDKTNYFDGTFMPSTDFTGGYRLCPFLDTSEPKHATLKELFLSTLANLHNRFIPLFLSSMSELFTHLEHELSDKGQAYFNTLSDDMAFDFLFRLFCEKSPSETSLRSDGPTILNKWVFFQLAPLISLGLKHVPNFIEDLVLHTFPLPFFPLKSDYKKIFDVFYKSMGSILDEAEKLGLKRDEACHNFIFLAGFNSYGGMKVFFPALIRWVGAAGESLHRRLTDEIRTAVKEEGGVTFSALNRMSLTKSVVYETLRIDPPVPFQTAKAREDVIIHSHDSSFLIKKDEIIFGYQPLATKDPKIFENPEEFIADRFVGDKEELIKYVYWSNGKESDDPTVDDKQCPGKDLVVLLGRLMLVEFFLRYDTFEIEFGKLLLGSKVTFKSVTKATS
ncbi:PREDICTED: allene oxide synthase 3-like [Nicotiana attenuata]|uniref:Allene oxide synthase 3 n=1 Tax=Nicotiana attenuata TaxID=49451 RepID=A0A1J6I096_NICAT|nr:PREDICTED: allene oxide synthase 3-like [Nicotiana attenuata]OIS97939.1 allene oxide synthase 3 [Nicotiana attenuata]